MLFIIFNLHPRAEEKKNCWNLLFCTGSCINGYVKQRFVRTTKDKLFWLIVCCGTTSTTLSMIRHKSWSSSWNFLSRFVKFVSVLKYMSMALGCQNVWIGVLLYFVGFCIWYFSFCRCRFCVPLKEILYRVFLLSKIQGRKTNWRRNWEPWGKLKTIWEN